MAVANEPTNGMCAPSDEDRSKDEFFLKLAQLGEAMIAAHGKEFTMGALILAARFIAQGQTLIEPKPESASERMTAAAPPP
jgi:hypothetical protein